VTVSCDPFSDAIFAEFLCWPNSQPSQRALRAAGTNSGGQGTRFVSLPDALGDPNATMWHFVTFAEYYFTYCSLSNALTFEIHSQPDQGFYPDTLGFGGK